MNAWLAQKLLRLWGFTIKGDPANHLPKRIFAVVPHTSSWDFPLGILTRAAKHIDVRFIGKDSLFKPPFGFLFRWLGGYPVDRSKRTNYVEKVVQIFNDHERFSIAIAPEGTRKQVTKLKTGFYHIARLAGIPIILTKFDFGNMEVVFSDPLYPGDDQDADFATINQFFSGTKGKNPQNSYNPAPSNTEK